MNYMIKELPEYKIAYMRRIGEYGIENYQLMEKLKNWAKRKGMLKRENIIFGIAQDDPQTLKASLCRYDVGITLDNTEHLDDDVKFTILPKGKYLVFKILHTEIEVQKFWSERFNIVNGLGETIDNQRVIIEQYPIELVDQGYCLMCVPLK